MQINKSMSIVVLLLIVAVLGIWFLTSRARDKAVETESAVTQEAGAVDITNTKEIKTMNNEQIENQLVTLHTSKGDITLELYTDKTPITAGNFLKLAKEGFYDNIKFHRVIPGFMIQAGDPNSRGEDESIYGMGGPGYVIQDEFAAGLSNLEGTISMANAGPNTGGSQFFINTADNVFLDGKHPVFGRVVSGMENVHAIESVETKERDIPIVPVVINSVEISTE